MAIATATRIAEYDRWEASKSDLGGIISLLASPLLTSVGTLFKDFPQTYSGPVVFDASKTLDAKAVAVEEIPAAEQVRAVLDFFGVSKSDLAKALRVTRPTVYAWLDGVSEPLAENQRRLSILARVAARLGGDFAGPLFHAYVEQPVEGFTESLFQMLLCDDLDEGALTSAARRVKEMTSKRKERIARGRGPGARGEIQAEKEAQNLEHNLSGLSPEA